MSFLIRAPLSRMQLSVPLPPKSDRTINVSITPISESGGYRRAANGDFVSIARAVFKKYKISISGSDMIPPGIQGLFPGDYVECVVPDFMTFNGSSINRASVDAHGLDENGQKFNPETFLNESDYSRAVLQSTFSSSRVASLRANGATQVAGASAIRCRPIFACRVISWSTSKEEAKAQLGWNLELEEH